MKMSQSFLLLAAIFLALVAQAQDQSASYQALTQKAFGLYQNKEYAASAQTYEQAFNAAEATPGDLYNAACSWALAGKPNEAMKALNRAVAAGWNNLQHTKTDPDLSSLHAHAGWNSLVAELEKQLAIYEARFDQALRAELQQILDDDQRYRSEMQAVSNQYGWDSEEMKALWAKQSPLDAANEAKIVKILDEQGYPGKSKVGNLSNVAFLVIQHAPPMVQKKYLPMLQAAADAGELSKGSLALLIDRIRMRDGLPQIYGSQLFQNSATGKMEFHPIEDEPNVNKRRAEVGLPPLEEYARHFGLSYTLPKE